MEEYAKPVLTAEIEVTYKVKVRCYDKSDLENVVKSLGDMNNCGVEACYGNSEWRKYAVSKVDIITKNEIK